MSRVLKDVSLARIEFTENGRAVVLEFLNMFDGEVCAQLTARGILALHFDNAFDGDDDGLPTYVGEVECQEMQPHEFASELREVGYGFTREGGELFMPSAATFFRIRVEGGEVSLSLFCSSYHLAKL